MLRPLKTVFKNQDVPDLLVGLDSPDDAAVWKLDEQRALVVTTDFFTPVVDDPYDYGAIAAANALSDVYAMGGMPFLALSIAALPPNLPLEVSAEIIRGGAEKTSEAGVVIAGGHTIQDKEPKFGLVVLGFVDTGRIARKGGLQVGDHLLISKPLGFGTTTTALKRELATAEHVAEVTGWMKRLNRDAANLAVRCQVTAMTDITGFSLIGHAWEMANSSAKGLEIRYSDLPWLSCAKGYAEKYIFPGGASDNRLYFEQHVEYSADFEDWEKMLLHDPQTSGGLLMGIPENEVAAFQREAAATGLPVWDIGRVVEGNAIRIIR